jgi:hypothetical protein
VQEQPLQRGWSFVFFGRGVVVRTYVQYSSILSLPCFPCTYMWTWQHGPTVVWSIVVLTISSVIVGRSTTRRQLWLLGRVYCFVTGRPFVFVKWSVHVATTCYSVYSYTVTQL